MTLMLKSALAAVALTALTSGAAVAADCCCKDKDAKMACCDKKADSAPNGQTPAPQHQH